MNSLLLLAGTTTAQTRDTHTDGHVHVALQEMKIFSYPVTQKVWYGYPPGEKFFWSLWEGFLVLSESFRVGFDRLM